MSVPVFRLGLGWPRVRLAVGWIDGFALAAHTISAWLALTVAGGTFMFYRRTLNPPAVLLELVAKTPRSGLGYSADPMEIASGYAYTYLILAFTACTLLTFPVFGLGAAAARMGSLGRARRLAVLRLLGTTRWQTTRISLLTALATSVVGFGLGSLVYLASLPLWTFASFQGTPLTAAEMWLPAWLWLAVAVVILVLATLSTITGLWQVNVTPLGVARRSAPPMLRYWRALFFGAAVLATFIAGLVLRNTPIGGSLVAISVMLVFVLILVGAFNLVSPYLLQLVARLWAATGSPARLLAARRIVTDPRSAWRSVSSLAFLGLIAAFIVSSQISWGSGRGDDVFELIFTKDVAFGTLITLSIALITATAATTLNQASQTLDRAKHIVALDHMGIPWSVLSRARFFETVVPLAVTMALAMGTGIFLATALLATDGTRIMAATKTLSVIFAACLGLATIASQLGTPLERRLLQAGSARQE